MRCLFVILSVIGVTFVSSFAQNPTPERTPTPQELNRRMMEERQQTNQEFERLKNLKILPAVSEYNRVPSPSSKTLKEEKALLKEQAARRLPDKEDFAKNAVFLKLPKTGLIKLFPDLGCWGKYIVRADDPCQHSIPNSSYYSFRKKDHSGAKNFSDVGFKDNIFFTDGWMSQGIMVMLGNVPLENISINSDGMKFLSDYKTTTDRNNISRNFQELEKGVKFGNYIYSNLVPVSENSTYAMRVIAYRCKIPGGFDAFNFDKRSDIIVAFRVIRKHEDGSITILWKELQQKDSPKVKFSKEDEEKYKVKSI